MREKPWKIPTRYASRPLPRPLSQRESEKPRIEAETVCDYTSPFSMMSGRGRPRDWATPPGSSGTVSTPTRFDRSDNCLRTRKRDLMAGLFQDNQFSLG